MRGATAGFNTPTFVVDAPGGGGKRDVHSYEYYDRITGVSVYTAPVVKPGQFFCYVDPLDTLARRGPRALGRPERAPRHPARGSASRPAPAQRRSGLRSARYAAHA